MNTDPDGPQTYRIVVRGRLDKSWSHWFDGAWVECAGPEEANLTTLISPSADQAALRGWLNKLWDLNLTLVSVNRISADERRGESPGAGEARPWGLRNGQNETR